MKKILKSRIFIFVFGFALATGIGAYAYTVSSSNVSYDNSTSGLEADNVKDALDDLYTLSTNPSIKNFFTLSSSVVMGISAGRTSYYYPISFSQAIDWATASGNTLTVTKPGRVYIALGTATSRPGQDYPATISIVQNGTKKLSVIVGNFSIGNSLVVSPGDTINILIDGVTYQAQITNSISSIFVFQNS